MYYLYKIWQALKIKTKATSKAISKDSYILWLTCYVAQACKKNLRNGVSNLRTRTVKRFNYAKAAFYVYLLTMIMFVATNAAAKFAFINGVK